jgi:hypothetical protein
VPMRLAASLITGVLTTGERLLTNQRGALHLQKFRLNCELIGGCESRAFQWTAISILAISISGIHGRCMR